MTDKEKRIDAILQKLPETPGVYLMKNKDDDIIYVGKAKNLKNRVKSYFQKSASHGIKTQKLVEHVENIDWVQVNSETESLVLETNYIKEYRPKYNILMKDDKNFVYVKIDQKDDYPEIQIVREMKKDGAKYFGPKTSTGKLKETIDFLQKVFPLHYCKNLAGKPCIEYQMRKTFGPCLGVEGRESYRHFIQKVIEFFQGDYEKVLEDVKNRMMDAAKSQQFEKAAKYRDIMLSIENVQNKQIVSDTSLASQDILGVFHDLGKTFVSLFQIRAGKMIHNESYTLENEGSFDEMIQAFLTSFYEHAADMPKEILIPKETELKDELEHWFEEKLFCKIKILTPQKGKKNDLMELAQSNAKGFAERERARWMSDKLKKDQAEQDIVELINQGEFVIARSAATKQSRQDHVDLEKSDADGIAAETESPRNDNVLHSFPKRMECFDISHFQGASTVASMVVFLDGEEAKSEYRHYKLKTLEQGKIDDFHSMEEILGRRLAEIENTIRIAENGELPANYELRKLKKKEVDEIFPQNKVLFLTGPSASGKTTISNLIAQEFKYKAIHGDEIKESIFGDEKGVWKDEEKMKKICDQIIKKTQEYLKKGHLVVIDYWANQMILDCLKNSFDEQLEIKIFLPKIELALERDQNRGDHIAGEEAIYNLYNFYNSIKERYKSHVIDNSSESAQETVHRCFSHLKQNSDYYALFQKNDDEKEILEPLYFAEIQKHDAKALELKQEFGEEHERKNFFIGLFGLLTEKDIWAFGENLETFESFGFKKLKTLEKNWQLNPGLVPESIAQNAKQEAGFAFKIRVPKKSKGAVKIPDFMLIDGGKGQLSSVIKVFEEAGWTYKNNAFYLNEKTKIVVCSLAKREEEVFFPFESLPRILPNTTEGSYLLQRLRDEAHRFAITFNRDSREKVSMQSELDAIEGVGPSTKKKLLKTFGSVEGIKKADFKNLELCVGEKIAKSIIQILH